MSIQLYDIVRLKAGGGPMMVLRVAAGCDGNGRDGLGLAARRVVEDFKAGDRTFKQVEASIEGLNQALEELLVAPGA